MPPGPTTFPFDMANLDARSGTAVITVDASVGVWIKHYEGSGNPTDTSGPMSKSGYCLFSAALGRAEGASNSIVTDTTKGYAFPAGAISQEMLNAPDLISLRYYRVIE